MSVFFDAGVCSEGLSRGANRGATATGAMHATADQGLQGVV